ncbi:MAG: hypothetical protein OXC41_01725 [Gammaproteobacteria bacterium]|nr:hypothetical protein [Gammaproteobacteria bacterium]
MKYVVLGICIVILTACGGGGGGSLEQRAFQKAAQGATSGQTYTQRIRGDLTAAQVTRITDSLEQLMERSSAHVFGSVAQSYRHGVSPIEGVDTSFDGDRFTLTLNREDGSRTTLDSQRHGADLANTYDATTNPVTRRPAIDGVIYDIDANHITVAGTAMGWSNSDFTDYLAGGYWMHVDLAAPAMADDLYGAEIGAFIDGPDYEDRTRLPATGTATYTGIASGAYIATYGSDLPIPGVGDPVPGAVETGNYGGNLILQADFAEGTVSGWIENVLVDGFVLTPEGAFHDANPMPGHRIRLAADRIAATGRISGSTVELHNSDLNIIAASGSWASRFSTVDDGEGMPRAIAGTHAGRFETAGGTETIFVGMHHAASEKFD